MLDRSGAGLGCSIEAGWAGPFERLGEIISGRTGMSLWAAHLSGRKHIR
jgi:hypothetical protein